MDGIAPEQVWCTVCFLELNGCDIYVWDQVQSLFEEQATMLRKMIRSNAVIRDEWRRSKEKLLLAPEVKLSARARSVSRLFSRTELRQVGQEQAITLGEAHVLLELQIANQVSRTPVQENRFLRSMDWRPRLFAPNLIRADRNSTRANVACARVK